MENLIQNYDTALSKEEIQSSYISHIYIANA